MTKLLEKALAELARQSPERQDAIAQLVLDELTDDAAWDARFAASPDALAGLADEARREYRSGETKPGGFGRDA